MTKSTGKNRPRHKWSRAELRILNKRYPHEDTKVIAADFGLSIYQVYAKANEIGLKKTAEYLASPASSRLRRGDNIGAAYRFPPGHVPANKGLRRPGYAPGRMRETQFKKGQFPIGKDPAFYVLGALRVNADGYIDMRISFEHGALGWTALHRILWQDAHGPIPKGHVLIFKDGDSLNVCLENLELLTLRENMARNTIARFPPALRAAIQLARKAERKIREREQRQDH